MGSSQEQRGDSMPSFSETEPGPGPRSPHRWLLEERVTLAVLVGDYNLKPGSATVVALMNSCHRSKSRFSKGSCQAQWSVMQHSYKFFAQILSDPHQASKRKFVTRKQLEERAKRLGISDLSAEGNKMRFNERQTNQCVAEVPSTPRLETATFQIVNDGESLPNNGLMTPVSPIEQLNSLSEEALPRLAFRVFDELSQGTNGYGFVAGKFKNQTIPPCPKGPLYIREALRHTAPSPPDSERGRLRPELLSGFISTSPNLIRIIHRAMKLSEYQSQSDGHSGPYIATIDVHAARKHTSVRSTKSLNLKSFASHRYVPGGELIFWGSINKESVLGVVDFRTFLLRFNDDLVSALGFDLMSTRSSISARKLIQANPFRISTSFTGGLGCAELFKSLSIQPDVDLIKEFVYNMIREWDMKSGEFENNGPFLSGIEIGIYGYSDGQLSRTFEGLDQNASSHETFEHASNDDHQFLDELLQAASTGVEEKEVRNRELGVKIGQNVLENIDVGECESSNHSCWTGM